MLKHAPRALGALCILLGALSLRNQFSQGILLLLAGLPLLLSKKKTIDEQTTKFVDSLKLKKPFFLALLFDVLFLLVLTALGYGLDALMAGSLGKAIVPGAPEQVAQSLGALKSFFVTGIIAITVFFLVLSVSYAASRILIWNSYLKKKVNWKRALWFGPAWMGIWVVLFALVLMQQPGVQIYGITIVLILWTHANTVPWMSLLAGKRIPDVFADTFRVGIGMLGRYFVPYAYGLVVFMILGALLGWLAPQTAKEPMSWLFVLVFLAWMRGYLAKIVWPRVSRR